jgi:hypothetical protein
MTTRKQPELVLEHAHSAANASAPCQQRSPIVPPRCQGGSHEASALPGKAATRGRSNLRKADGSPAIAPRQTPGRSAIQFIDISVPSTPQPKATPRRVLASVMWDGKSVPHTLIVH